MCQDIAMEADTVITQAAHALSAVQRYEGCRQLVQKVQLLYLPPCEIVHQN